MNPSLSVVLTTSGTLGEVSRHRHTGPYQISVLDRLVEDLYETCLYGICLFFNLFPQIFIYPHRHGWPSSRMQMSIAQTWKRKLTKVQSDDGGILKIRVYILELHSRRICRSWDQKSNLIVTKDFQSSTASRSRQQSYSGKRNRCIWLDRSRLVDRS